MRVFNSPAQQRRVEYGLLFYNNKFLGLYGVKQLPCGTFQTPVATAGRVAGEPLSLARRQDLSGWWTAAGQRSLLECVMERTIIVK